MTNKEMAKTIFEACSIATAMRAKGDLKGARELLDRVAEILDILLYLSSADCVPWPKKPKTQRQERRSRS